jgi:hypothetical protein
MPKFIDQIATGDASGAKNTMSDMLSAKAFEALDTRKQELAASLFGGSPQEAQEEVELNLEDFSLEELEEFALSEEFEQLDELSKGTVRSYLKGVKKENDPRVHGDSAGPANQMSDKARSLGRTEQDKEDSRYEGKRTAIAKLGGSNSVLASKVPAK